MLSFPEWKKKQEKWKKFFLSLWERWRGLPPQKKEVFFQELIQKIKEYQKERDLLKSIEEDKNLIDKILTFRREIVLEILEQNQISKYPILQKELQEILEDMQTIYFSSSWDIQGFLTKEFQYFTTLVKSSGNFSLLYLMHEIQEPYLLNAIKIIQPFWNMEKAWEFYSKITPLLLQGKNKEAKKLAKKYFKNTDKILLLNRA